MTMKFGASVNAVALLAAILAGGTLTAQAQAEPQKTLASPVTLHSQVKIERIVRDDSGNEKTNLFTPNDVAVVPGDSVLFTLLVNNTGADPAIGFKATNPMPSAVRFASVTEEWAEVSIDGGNSFGKLAELKVVTKDAAGTAEIERAATTEDVTHVRWVFADAIASGTQRTVSYRGVVK